MLARNANAFAPVIALLETALAQSPADKLDASIARELALVYGDRAERELAAFAADAALNHLQRANQLAPDHLPIAQRFCALLLERNNREHAAQVLERLLRVSRDENDKTKAQQLLAAIKAKG
jgi:DNA-binding SARP family transcriptional activator